MEQRLLDIRLHMEMLISVREGMIAENLQRVHNYQSIAYIAKDFDSITIQLSQLLEITRHL
jgi:hypothetical protein